MKHFSILALCASMGCLISAHAAEPPKDKPKELTPEQKKGLQKLLDPLLENWETAAKKLESMHVTFACEKTNAAFGGVTKLDGDARFLRTEKGYLAYLEFRDPAKGGEKNYEKLLHTGDKLYVFTGATGVIDVFPVDPKKQGKAPNDGPLALLFGMSAKEAKARYDLEITQQSDDEKKWITYLKVTPKFPKDKADFLEAHLAVYNHATKEIPQSMPKMITYFEPNKNKVVWDISNLKRNGDCAKPEHFTPPDEKNLPKGWKMQVNKQEK